MKNILKQIFENLREVPSRFPVAVISLVILCGIGFLVVHSNRSWDIDDYIASIMTFITLFLLSIAGEFFSGVYQYKTKGRILTQLIIIIFVGLYFLLLPKDFNNLPTAFWTAQFIWFICFFVLIFITPYLLLQNINNNDIYKRTLKTVLAIIIGWIFAIVSFVLGALLLWSLDELFGLDVENGFGYWWVISATLIGPMIVLSRLPYYNKYQLDENLPKIVHIFLLYIVIPFVTLYFVILYAYTGKILFLWQWPEGIVSWMIIIFSVIGWVAYMLIFPWRDSNKLFFLYTKFFPWIALPQIIMLFIALWWRINAYGITINRYLVALFGIWLLINALYYGYSKSKKLILIAYTFCGLLVLASFGPLGMFNVSRESQSNRLITTLRETQLIDSKGQGKKNDDLSQKEQNNIISIMQYIDDTYGSEALMQVLPNITKQAHLAKYCTKSECNDYDLIKVFDINYSYDYFEQNKNYINYHYEIQNTSQATNIEILDVQKYDFVIPSIYFYNNRDDDFFIANNQRYNVKYIDNKIIIATEQNKSLLNIDLMQLLQKAKNMTNTQKFVQEYSNDNIEVNFIIKNISGSVENNAKNHISVNGIFMFNIKK